MRTDLATTVRELMDNTPSDKREDAMCDFFRIYNSYASCRNLMGSEYDVKMNDKLTHAYKVATKEVTE